MMTAVIWSCVFNLSCA